jgi:hypothetical protein
VTKQKSNQAQMSSIARLRVWGKESTVFLKKLMSSYPGFANLPAGDQLDRMVLILQSACGYGAVSKRIVEQIQERLNWQPGFDIEGHFRSAKYESVETASDQTRYRESFEGAYCLKREFMNLLSNEGEESSSNEPIRKKVKVPEASVAPIQSQKPMPGAKSQGPKAQTAGSKPASTVNTKSSPAEAKTPAPQSPQTVAAQEPQAATPQQAHHKGGGRETTTATPSEQPSVDNSPFKPWMILAATAVLIVIAIAIFAVNS